MPPRALRSRTRGLIGGNERCCARSRQEGAADPLRQFRRALDSASAAITIPAAMEPPRYSPSAEMASKVVAVPRSTMQAAHRRVYGPRPHPRSGLLLLAGILDPDTHSRLCADVHDQRRVSKVVTTACTMVPVRGGTTDAKMIACTSPGAIPACCKS